MPDNVVEARVDPSLIIIEDEEIDEVYYLINNQLYSEEALEAKKKEAENRRSS
jgi:hypothetical protein